jgi:hypothetical protein
MFLCEHPWDTPVTNFAIFQCTEVDIQLRTQSLGHNPPIQADELIETLFISWADSCAGPPRRPCRHCWNAPTVSSLCSRPLIALRKRSANVVECQWVQFFPYVGIQWHQWFLRAFVSNAIMPHWLAAAHCCYLSHGNKTYKLLAGKFNLSCNTTSIRLWRHGPTKYEALFSQRPFLGARESWGMQSGVTWHIVL